MWKRIKRKILTPFLPFYYRWLYRLYAGQKLFLYWYDREQNFGDTINPLFVSALSGKEVIRVEPKFAPIPHILAIGSIMEHGSRHSIVWGSGFISETSTLPEKPKKVLAVRGPKSRERLLALGIDCPEVYGDPVLLLPKVYRPHIEKRYRLGIVPHHMDKSQPWLQRAAAADGSVKIIDLQRENLWEIVDDILSCEKIASSSLHGMITADAYGIPSVWIQFSDKVVGKGFKFRDYFASVGRREHTPYIMRTETSVEDILALFQPYTIDIDLQKLMDAAPFEIRLKKGNRQSVGKRG